MVKFHTPNPGSDPDPPKPGREMPEPSVPPDIDPVPIEEPPTPGRPGDREPPAIFA